MQLPDDTITRIEAAVAQEARRHTDLVQTFLQDLQVKYPAFVGLWAGILGSVIGLLISGNTSTVVIGGLIVSAVALTVTIVTQSRKNRALQGAYVSTTEVYLAFTRERERHQLSHDAQERLLMWLLTAAVMLKKARTYVDAARANPAGATPDAAQKLCDAILQDMEEARHRCLRYKPDDATYNLHIFRFDAGKQALVTFARRHGSRVKVTGREWRLGMGHAGRCFEDAEILCLPDMEGPEGMGYRRQEQELDKALYRAIVDAPIHCGAETWGVLAVTSGEPGQFTEADFPALALVTDILGVVVAATRWSVPNATPQPITRGARK